MLLSLCLALKPRGKNVRLLPPTLGKAAYAGFLELIGALDADMAERLHSAREKPFTLCLYRGDTGITPGESASDTGPWLRITSLDACLSRFLLEMASCPGGWGPLRLLDIELEIVKAYNRQEEHPWAGETSFVELYNNWVARAKRRQLPEDIWLEFCTPTAFAISGSEWDLPLPLPRLVFQSLFNKWTAFSSIPLDLKVEEIGRYVGIKRYSLRTQMLQFGERSKRQLGFVGVCEFGIRREAGRDFRQLINLLADFAFYAGVGKKTAWGMGQVRRRGKALAWRDGNP